MMKKLCLSALSLLLSFAAIADSVEVDGIFYYLDAGTKTAEVTNNPFGYKGSVNIPASVTYSGTDYVVTSIGSRAFHSSTDLTSVTIGDGVTAIGYDAFSYCRSLASVTLGNSVASIGLSAFESCSALTTLSIPNSVTSIEGRAFESCDGLTSVVIESSVTAIGSLAFCDCISLTSVILGDSVTKIEDAAFQNCRSLTSIVIPNSVTDIGYKAFNGCSGLTSITIGSGVNNISYLSFNTNSLELTDVYCLAENVPNTDYSAFSNTDCATLHVPAQSIEAYKVADPWKNFKDIVPLDGESIETPQYTFPDNRISIYTADGKLIGSTTSKERAETIINNLKRGSLAIIRMGGKSEKRVIP